jgi:endonuclease/exonuclease/phosphatase family metal-dependent hydrolase
MPRARTLLVTLIAVLLLAAPAGARGLHAPDRELRVITFNIHHGADGAEQLDLERVAQVIEDSGADVAALQEVDRHWSERSAFADQAAELGRRLRMRAVYAANLDLDPLEAGQPRRQYGTAILSRYPIASWHNTLLPRPDSGEQRGLLEAVLKVHGVRVRMANTHLQHNSALERTAQAQRIAELLAPAKEPVVLAGDLNAVPDAPELTPLFGAFADSWTRAGSGPGYTIPVEAPDRRIDYVLTSPQIGARHAEVVATGASDHLPLVVDLAVPHEEGERLTG